MGTFDDGSFGGWSEPPSDEKPSDAPTFGADADRYRIEGRLGEGGMGEVFRAWDTWLERPVALKQVHRRLGGDELRARLLREARVTARLDHPGIVPVLDVGDTADGRLFYTMRLIRGRTLADLAPDLTRPQQLRHLVEAVRAVAYAHARGVVHRDLKPANVMVGELGETCVVDWGLSRPVDSDEVEEVVDWTAVSGELTTAGAVIGTQRYLSPEAASGVTSLASDVFALGAVMVEVLTGQRGEDPASWHALAEELEDPVLAAIAHRALSPDADDRYVDARGLLDDLTAYQDDRAVGAYAYSTVEVLRRALRRYRWPLRVGAAAVTTAVVVLGVAGARVVSERDRAVAAEEQAQKARAVADDTLARSLASQAATAIAEDRTADAEVLAAHALAIGELPRARGVLMGARAVTGRVERRDGCVGAWRAHRTGWLCIDGNVLHGDVDVTLPDDGVPGADGVWVGVDTSLHWYGLDGASRVFEPALGTGIVVEGPRAVRYQMDLALLADADGRSRDIRPCEGRAVHDVWFRGDEIVFACLAGGVETWGFEGPPVRVQTDVTGARAVAATADVVLLALDEEVVRVDARSGAELDRMAPDIGLLRDVQVDEAGRWALVIGGDGPPTVLDLTTGQVLLRLPRAWRRPVLGSDGVVRTSGSPALSLDLAGVVPHRYVEPYGIAAAVAAPDDRIVAFAMGSGQAVGWDRATGLRRFETMLGADRVTKWIAWDADGRGFWVSNLSARGAWLLDPDGHVLRAPEPDYPWECKRLVSLRGAAPLCGTYGHLFPASLDASAATPSEHYFVDSDQSGPDVAVFLDDAGAVWLFEPEPRLLVAVPGAARVGVDASGHLVAVTTDDGVALYRDGEPITVLSPTPETLQDVAVHPSGRWVAASGLDGVHLWSVDPPALVAVLPDVHVERVANLLFTSDALVTAGWDGVAREWSLAAASEPVRFQDSEARWGLTLADLVDDRTSR